MKITANSGTTTGLISWLKSLLTGDLVQENKKTLLEANAKLEKEWAECIKKIELIDKVINSQSIVSKTIGDDNKEYRNIHNSKIIDKSIYQTLNIYGKEDSYDKREMFKLFALHLNREKQQTEFIERFVEPFANLNNPRIFFVYGQRADKPECLIYRFNEIILTNFGNQIDFQNALIEEDIFHNVQSFEGVKKNLYSALGESSGKMCYKNFKKHIINGNDLLNNLSVDFTVLIFRHDILTTELDQTTEDYLQEYIKFWNCSHKTKVAIFINIINNQSVDSNRSIEVDADFRNMVFKMTVLPKINSDHIFWFTSSLNKKKPFSFSIKDSNQLKIGEEITLDEAIEKYEKDVASYILLKSKDKKNN